MEEAGSGRPSRAVFSGIRSGGAISGRVILMRGLLWQFSVPATMWPACSREIHPLHSLPRYQDAHQGYAMTTTQFEEEVKAGERFEFGSNWARFLSTLTDQQIESAEESLREMLEVKDLRGLRFLDIGCGSGLFSLAARRMGATVHSFDYDPNSVGCARTLRAKYFPDDPNWVVEQGSALDPEYVKSLGSFDIVYSWGVLHHTGAMWPALQNAVLPTTVDGKLWIAIYNFQGTASGRWTAVKRFYNKAPRPIKMLTAIGVLIVTWWRRITKDFLLLRPFDSWRNYPGRRRGMTPWRDVVDWVGGYPFEVAKPEEIFDFYRQRGFTMTRMKTCGGSMGCNEFVFQRTR
jgi:SAM-dependent methyltransferase